MYYRRIHSICHPSPLVCTPVTAPPKEKINFFNIKIFVKQFLMLQGKRAKRERKKKQKKNLVHSLPRCKNVLKIPVLFKPCQSVTISGYVQPLPWNTLNVLPLPCLCSWCISYLCKLLQSSNTANKTKKIKNPIFTSVQWIHKTIQEKKKSRPRKRKGKQRNKPSRIHQDQHHLQHPHHSFGHLFRRRNLHRPWDQMGTSHGRTWWCVTVCASKFKACAVIAVCFRSEQRKVKKDGALSHTLSSPLLL